MLMPMNTRMNYIRQLHKNVDSLHDYMIKIRNQVISLSATSTNQLI